MRAARLFATVTLLVSSFAVAVTPASATVAASTTSKCGGPSIQDLRLSGGLVGTIRRDCIGEGPVLCRSHVAVGHSYAPGPPTFPLHFYRNDLLVFELDGPNGVVDHVSFSFNGESQSAAVAPFTADVSEFQGEFGNVNGGVVGTSTGDAGRHYDQQVGGWSTLRRSVGSPLGSGSINFTLDGGNLDVVLNALGGGAPLHVSGSWRDPPGCAAKPAGPTGVGAAPPKPAGERTVSTSSGTSLEWLWIVLGVGGVLVLLVLLTWILLARRVAQPPGVATAEKPPPPCDCSCLARIVGPEVLYLGDDDITWQLHQSDGGDTSPIINLVGTTPDGHRLEATYVVDVTTECRGGGAPGVWQVKWELVDPAPDHVGLHVTVTGQVNCPGATPSTCTCSDLEIIELRAHCGPDITDGFLRSLNRILERFDAIDALHTVIGTTFLAGSGLRMIYRPLAPGVWTPGGCPSCRRCADTITLLGVCVNAYVTGDFLYGFCAGYLDVPDFVRDFGGDLAKKARGWATNPDREVAEAIWPIAADIGRNAARAQARGRSAQVTRDDLARLIPLLRVRGDCTPCETQGPEPPNNDFSREKWYG